MDYIPLNDFCDAVGMPESTARYKIGKGHIVAEKRDETGGQGKWYVSRSEIERHKPDAREISRSVTHAPVKYITGKVLSDDATPSTTIDELRAENERLREEVASLRQQLSAKLATPSTTSTPTVRAQPGRGGRNVVSVSQEYVEKVLSVMVEDAGGVKNLASITGVSVGELVDVLHGHKEEVSFKVWAKLVNGK